MKLVETYDDGYRDFEVWECECGWVTTIPAGADIACCPQCEEAQIRAEVEMELEDEERYLRAFEKERGFYRPDNTPD